MNGLMMLKMFKPCYFTDGYGTVEPEQEPECPVVWCVTDKSRYSENLPFGEVVYVDTADFYA